MESQPPAITLGQSGHIHHFGLERIETIQPDPKQIIEEFIYVPTRVDEDIFAGRVHHRIHALEHRVNELMPQLWAHLQAMLLSPVIPEIDCIDIILDGFLDLDNVVIGDGIQQAVDEIGMVIKIHQ